MQHRNNETFKKLLNYSFSPEIHFNVVKIPKTEEALRQPGESGESWEYFFDAADKCSRRIVTGHAAIDVISKAFLNSTAGQEEWMRKILKKRLSIGISVSSINKMIPGLIFTFKVALAQKFDFARIPSHSKQVGIDPKLDGIRCLSIVRNGEVAMRTRSGKPIVNFNSTIGQELSELPDGVYDGEIMGKDFTELMRQVNKKVGANIADTYFGMFDYITLEEWDSKKGVHSCLDRYTTLTENIRGGERDRGESFEFLNIVERDVINKDIAEIQRYHKGYIDQGYEGSMIKNLDATYCFGRDWTVMKFKDFLDADVEIVGFKEGTGKHSGKLGSFLVDYKGIEVNVGSGLNDELRELIWNNKDDYLSKLIEVKYQEETDDGSLRFPTFVCFRNDR